MAQLALRFAACLLVALPVAAQSTTRASVGSGGVQSHGHSTEAWIRQDGREVYFTSDDGLVPGDVDGWSDIHVHDRQTGQTRLLIIGQGNVHPNDSHQLDSISPDGRFVAFNTAAYNLVVGDFNGCSDVFLFDRQTLVIVRVSIAAGNEGNSDSDYGMVSDDGRFVAFTSWADNLFPGDTNQTPDIFVHEVATGATTCASLNPQGFPQTTGGVYQSSFSGDGSFVAFYSEATDLVANDTNGSIMDVFLFERATGLTTIASLNNAGLQSDFDCVEPDLSRDGRFVVFDSASTNLAAGDTNGAQDVFRRDRLTNTTARVSLSNAGAQADSDCYRAKVNANGNLVSFVAWASNLVPGDTNVENDLFLRDVQAGTTERISVTSAGGEMFTTQTLFPTIFDHELSPDGRFLAFSTIFEPMVVGDDNATLDVIVRDRQSTCAPVLGYCVPKTNSLGCVPAIGASGEPRLSGPDAFFVTATNVLNKKSGILIWSPNATSVPFGGGTLCVGAPTKRTTAQSSGGTPSGNDCTGVYTFHFSQAYLGAQGIAGGTTLRAQYWSRDKLFPAPNNVGLTAGVEFTVHP